MTIEEMQEVWSEMTERIEKQEHLTNSLIMEMTKEKFRSKIGKISRYESAGAIVCVAMAIFVLLNLGKLDTWYLLASGVFVAAYLIVIPFIVLKYIRHMKSIDLVNNTYKQSLIEFSKRRRQFLFWQRLGLFANILLMVLVLPVSSKLADGRDLFIEGGQLWIGYIIVMVLFLVPFSIWGYRSYSKMTASAADLLKDLELKN